MVSLFREIPSQIKGYIAKFRRFFTKPQLKHFTTLISGLIINDKKTLQEINDSLSNKDQSSLNRFATKSKWDIDAVNATRIRGAKKSLCLGRHGMMIVDSTLAHKTGKHMEKANYHRSGVTKRQVWGHCIVDSVFSDDRNNLIPVDAKIYAREVDSNEKDPYKSKRQMAMEQIDFALAQGLPVSIVAADAEFYADFFAHGLKERGLKHILGARVTNKVSIEGKKRVSIDEYLQTITDADFRFFIKDDDVYFLHMKTVYVRGIGKEKLLVSYKYGDEENVKIYLTDLLEENEETLMNLLLQRWKIETWHRDAKQHLGLEDYQVRKYRGIQVVVLAVLVAYTLLVLNKVQNLLEPLKRSLETIGEGCRYLRLIALKGWNWLREKADDVLALKEILNRHVFVKNAKV